MASITLPESELRKRSNTLHKLFTPLRGKWPRVAIRFSGGSPGGTITLVATDEKAGVLLHRGDSFRTSTQVLRCRYYEQWQVSTHSTFRLYRAYFTLLEVVRAAREYDELLCIHTDPADNSDLKRGPHLHVSCAPDPMQRCHFPLEFGFLEVVLKDCDSLTIAMQRAINVVARDVLPRFEDR